jgi:hypothetical protein
VAVRRGPGLGSDRGGNGHEEKYGEKGAQGHDVSQRWVGLNLTRVAILPTVATSSCSALRLKRPANHQLVDSSTFSWEIPSG